VRKLDLANAVRERVGGLSKKETSELIDRLLETIRKTLVKGDEVKIGGFGTFSVRQKRDRKGRNPHTGGDLMITARRVLTFRPSQLLRDRLNP